MTDFIKSSVRRAVRNVDMDRVRTYIRERGGDVDRWLDKLEERGVLGPEDRGQGPRVRPAPRPYVRMSVRNGRERSMEERRSAGEPPVRQDGSGRAARVFNRFRRYRDKVRRAAGRAATGLRAHASVFLGFNIFLIVIWAVTGAGHPWFLYPAGAWGIGLANHLNAVRQSARKEREVASLPELTDDETRILKKMHDERSGLSAHAASAVSISAFLFMVNVITGFGFPWFVFPAGALAFSLFVHWTTSAPRIRKRKKMIRAWSGGDRKRQLDAERHSERDRAFEHPVVQEAAAVKRTIERQLEQMTADHPSLTAEMKPLLEQYFDQVKDLAARASELDELVEPSVTAELQRDRARLVGRMRDAESPSLAGEYEKSIAEIDRQVESMRELRNNREMLDLRLRSSVNLLKQLQIDLARVKGVHLTGTEQSRLLHEKSEELSEYIKDLESGYSELDASP